MKKVTQSATYQCDSCMGTPVASNTLPAGWKELQVNINVSGKPSSRKVMEICGSCCVPGNVRAAELLVTLLK
jgi:hypothetical protein